MTIVKNKKKFNDFLLLFLKFSVYQVEFVHIEESMRNQIFGAMQYSMNEQEVAAIKSHIFDIPFKAVKVEAATYAFTRFCECCGRKYRAKKNKWIYCKDCFWHYYG